MLTMIPSSIPSSAANTAIKNSVRSPLAYRVLMYAAFWAVENQQRIAMARPRKTGLDYFSLNCDLDEKFAAMEIRYQNDGFSIPIKVYQMAFKGGTGTVNLNDPLQRLTLIDRCNVSEERLIEILQFGATIRLFDAEQLEQGIVTSNGIQKQLEYIEEKRDVARGRFTAKNSSETKQKRKVKPERTGESKSKSINTNIKEKDLINLHFEPSAAHVGEIVAAVPEEIKLEEIPTKSERKTKPKTDPVPRVQVLEFLHFTPDGLEKIKNELGEDLFNRCAQKLDAWIGSNPTAQRIRNGRNAIHTFRSWVIDSVTKQNNGGGAYSPATVVPRKTFAQIREERVAEIKKKFLSDEIEEGDRE